MCLGFQFNTNLPERIAESLFNERVGTQFKKQNHVTLVFLAQLSMMVVKRRRCTFSRRRRAVDATLQSARHPLRTHPPMQQYAGIVSGSGQMRGEGWGCVVREVTGGFNATGGSCGRYKARGQEDFSMSR